MSNQEKRHKKIDTKNRLSTPKRVLTGLVATAALISMAHNAENAPKVTETIQVQEDSEVGQQYDNSSFEVYNVDANNFSAQMVIEPADVVEDSETVKATGDITADSSFDVGIQGVVVGDRTLSPDEIKNFISIGSETGHYMIIATYPKELGLMQIFLTGKTSSPNVNVESHFSLTSVMPQTSQA